MTPERRFKMNVFVPKIQRMFPKAVILYNDPTLNRSIPDMLVLFEETWAMFETKRARKANRQPNQEFYVDLLDHMAFARFVYPENMDQVIDELLDFLAIYDI